MAEEEMKEDEGGIEGKIKVVALKVMEDFQVSIEFLDEKAITASKAMKDFRIFEDFCDENDDFTTAAYYEGVKSARNKTLPSVLDWTWASWMNSQGLKRVKM